MGLGVSSLEDKLDRYYDDLMEKLLEITEQQTRITGDHKELKKEVAKLREIVLQMQTDVAAILNKVSMRGGGVSLSASSEAKGSDAAEAGSGGEKKIEIPVPQVPETSTVRPRSLKEILSEEVSIYDVKVLNAFIKATKEIIKANARKEPSFVKPRVEEKMLVSAHVAGRMSLTRDNSGKGAMALAFPRETIELVVRDVFMLPPEARVSDMDCQDVTSELCNQVCGKSKILLRNDGYNFDISVPQVVYDSDPKAIVKQFGFPKIALVFEYEKKIFHVLFWG